MPHTAWIARHALRTLIKRGDRRALAVIGAGEPRRDCPRLLLHPGHRPLGERIALTCRVESTAAAPQRLVIDYIVHYVKGRGTTSAKVFKWRELTLAPGETVTLSRTQQIRDFSTRVHHAGRHDVEIMVNGERVARAFFDLAR